MLSLPKSHTISYPGKNKKMRRIKSVEEIFHLPALLSPVERQRQKVDQGKELRSASFDEITDAPVAV